MIVEEAQKLTLEAEVRIGRASCAAHRVQRLTPAQLRHRHDVGRGDGDAPRHPGNTKHIILRLCSTILHALARILKKIICTSKPQKLS